mgnify:FL=1
MEQIFDHHRHPYTEGLFGSLPGLDDTRERLSPIPGLMPDPTNLPEGCKFNTRCPYCTEECKQEQKLVDVGDGHVVRCAKWKERGEK